MDSWDIRSLAVEPHRPEILRTDDHARAVALHLPAGEELQEHQTHEGVYLVVVDGEVEIALDGSARAGGGPGFMAHFQPNERREVRAKSDARLVLILAPWPGVGHPSERR